VRLARYIGYRLVTALPVIFGIIVLNFLLIHLAPGDAASVLAGESGAATSE
jgi:peptide/nickel transport system permease protein